MRHKMILCSLIIVTLMCISALAQNTMLKVHYGYYWPKLSDVNAKINSDFAGWRNVHQEPIAYPGEFNGNTVWGVQVEYHVNEDFFLVVNFAYYNEDVSVNQQSMIYQFNYLREITMYDVMFNFH